MKKLSYFIMAWVSLALGVIGIVLPLLPTTPFVLLAAFGFSKSSKRFHDWLLSHSVFGPIIFDWQQSGVITTKTKLVATISMVFMLSISFQFITLTMTAKTILITCMSLVLCFIWTRPSNMDKREG